MKIFILLFCGLVAAPLCLTANEGGSQAASAYLTDRDKLHLKQVLEAGQKLTDISSVYYYVIGYKVLGEPIPNPEAICEYIINNVKDASDISVERASHAALSWKALGKCQNRFPTNVSKLLLAVLDKDSPTIAELYHATSGLIALIEKVPQEKVDKISKSVQNALKKDDSLWNLGYTFHIASELGAAGSFAFEHIEEALIQADEVDGRYLQFEGGLSLTSVLLNGMLKLSASLKKKAPISSQQMVKIASYLLSRRTVQTPKGALNLLLALTSVASNEWERPVCITLPEGGVSISREQPFLTVKVCDILGNPMSNMPKVLVNSATKFGESGSITSLKEALGPSATDKTLFTMNLMDAKLERGFYKISISAGTATGTVTVKVLNDVLVDHMEIGTGDADQATQPKLTQVRHPETLGQKIEADSQQKLVMRFLLKDASSRKPLRAHQVFVRLSSIADSKQGHEIIFVAEPDATNFYKFDMPIGTAATSFGYQSGEYNVELVIGDATISNPFQWVVATVSLKFPEKVGSGSAAAASGQAIEKNVSSYRQKRDPYSTKPEIQHMFREPEKRPPAFVSNLFTGLCLAPILLLLILWMKLGVNISNFPFSLSGIIFHLGLGSIFILFGIFWLRLNIFVTLRYLLGLGVVTFLAGNKLLSRIAQSHKLSR